MTNTTGSIRVNCISYRLIIQREVSGEFNKFVELGV